MAALFVFGSPERTDVIDGACLHGDFEGRRFRPGYEEEDPVNLFSIGVLFSDLASSSETAMLGRVWPFFLALVALGAAFAIFFALKGSLRGKPPRSEKNDRD